MKMTQREKQARLIDNRGKTPSVSALAKRHGLSRGTVHTRIKSGMSLDEALSMPVMQAAERCSKAGRASAAKRRAAK